MRALVVAGGPAPLTRPAGPFDLVVAVDSGLDHCRALGLLPHVVVGDLDSVEGATLAAAEALGVEVERHPSAKDASDLELGLLAARDRGATAVTVLAGEGGRLDHLVIGLVHLADDAYDGVALDAYVGHARVHVVRAGDGPVTVAGRPGEFVGLVAVGGAAEADLDGFAYGRRVRYRPTSTLGVSNEFAAPQATVRVATGRLLVIASEAVPAVVELALDDVLALRAAVLRSGTPDPDPGYPEDARADTVHLGVRLGGQVVAVSTWFPEPVPGHDPSVPAWQLRGMAVRDGLRSGGVGSAVLAAGVRRSHAAGAEAVWANARDSALGFCRRAGFAVEGEGFVSAATGLAHHVVTLPFW